MESLEIRVRSASGLKDLNTIGTMDPYVSVTLSNDPKSKQKTEVHTDGGKNPNWKGKPMKFAISEDMSKMQNVTLVFKIMAEKPFGDKEVGDVIVPIKELFQGDPHMEKSLSYSVSTPSGKPKGTLNFSYKVVKNANVCDPMNMPGAYGVPMAVGPGPGPYPPPNQQPQYAPQHPPPCQQPQYAPQHQQQYFPPTQQGYGQPQQPLQGYVYPAGTPPPPGQYAYPHSGAPPPQGQYAYPNGPGAYAFPNGGAPPPPGPYAYPHSSAPGYPSGHGNHQMKNGGKKPKSKTGGLLGLGALGIGAGLVGGMLLGGIASDLGDMASGFGDIAGGAAGDVAGYGSGLYDDSISSMNDSMDAMNSII